MPTKKSRKRAAVKTPQAAPVEIAADASPESVVEELRKFGTAVRDLRFEIHKALGRNDYATVGMLMDEMEMIAFSLTDIRQSTSRELVNRLLVLDSLVNHLSTVEAQQNKAKGSRR